MTTIAIIPARGGSKGISNKNIIDFCGKPLIAWSIEHALASKSVSEVYVSTDDSEIADISKKYGAKVIWRPDRLATDTSSSEEALLHSISEIEKEKKIDLVVFLQATSPLRDQGDVDGAVEKFFSENCDSLFSATVLDDFCIWEDVDSKLESLTFDYKSRGRRQDRKPYYLENGSIYIFKPEILKQHNNRLGGRIAQYLMPFWKSYEIDVIEDVEVCEYYMRNKVLKKERRRHVLKNIQLVVYDFDGVLTDNKVLVREDGLESVWVNRGDGLAIEMIKAAGTKQIILTKETNRVVEARARKLDIPVIKGVDDKKTILLDYCEENNLLVENVAYMGNDLNDIEIMKSVGHPICPLDACEEVKNISKIILGSTGGDGVVRELIEYLDWEK